ncbi:TetR/AcrR family transcriptional regulator [Pseudoduganella sp. R-32]|uniref:TetR/AcrR family transcriptional regulator n=1 Tax=Pseudoduganella sp. R-32 TaxID=3404061 RepID=UPI003CEE9DE7
MQKKTAIRASRQDGDATRQALLDVAGQVFAERGFADATSKEICARAGTNIAAVNYHFGSRGALYEAVLVEAHHHLLKLEDMQEIASRDSSPRDKLRLVLRGIVLRATGPDAHWGARVVIRELMSPTEHAPVLVHQAIAPKAMVMLGLVCELLGLPPATPGLQRALFLLMSPCLALLVAPREMRTKLFPALGDDAEGLVDDMMTYASAGLDAIAAKYSASPRPRGG